MAQYKVPQDVEADDKLLGPFNFRQFIYLLIVAGLIALAWALFQIFPVFGVFPLLPAGFLLLLALPLRKDQPMETYIAALIQFHTKPNRRFWNPGQRESTIVITAPKTIEKPLVRNISQEEAGRRLSFLANVVDSEGYSIKEGIGPASVTSTVRDEFIAEAEATPDIFENYQSTQLGSDLTTEADRYRAEVVQQMRAAIAANQPTKTEPTNNQPKPPAGPTFNSAVFSSPQPAPAAPTTADSGSQIPPTPPIDFTPEKPVAPQQDPAEAEHQHLVELSENKFFTVATIANEAHRTSKPSKKKDKDEVYISLH